MEKVNNLQMIGAQVYTVLNNIPRDEYYKVPKKITSLFEKYKDYPIDIKIDFEKSFDEQPISKDAKDIIYAIALNYWLTQEQREKAIEKMKQNENEFNERYSVENIFKDKSKNEKEISNENKELVVVNEKWYVKIFNKIISFFKRK